MQQLSGMDSMFLNVETTNAPMHIGGLAIYDQSSAPGGLVTFKGILANIERRLHLARCFRQKIVEVPLGLDHPYWIEDPDFDLEFHVRHIALPKPGDWRQLCIQTARIHARPLDRNKPLWEMYVIEGLDAVQGLPPGSFAILTKVHHCAIDGVSGVEMATAVHDLRPDAEPPSPEKRWVPESEPSLLELTARSTFNSIRQPLRFTRALADAAPPALRALWESSDDDEDEVAGPIPRIRFNGAISPHRVFEGRLFSLAEVKQIRKAVSGATVNDVMLCVCAGAMRRYLEEHQELPRESLLAFAPISVRTEDQRGSGGNQVSAMRVLLHTEVADPVKRLKKIRRGTRNSKKMNEAVGARSLTEMAQSMPGALGGMAGRLIAQTGMVSRLTPFAHSVITNVPGPQVPLYFTQAELVANFGLGMPMDGMGLFHIISSFNGRLTISVTSCRDMLPDPGFYADCLDDSFRELREASVS